MKLTIVIPGKLPSSKELLGFKLYFPLLSLPQNHNKLTPFLSFVLLIVQLIFIASNPFKILLTPLLSSNSPPYSSFCSRSFPSSLSPLFSHFLYSSIFQLVFFFYPPYNPLAHQATSRSSNNHAPCNDLHLPQIFTNGPKIFLLHVLFSHCILIPLL